MTTDIARQYDMVNSFMRLLGEAEIEPPSTDSAKEKMDYLISTYTSRLRSKDPKLAALPDELLPDALLVALREAYQAMFPAAKPSAANTQPVGSRT
jgi:hypothetical protein